MLSDASCIDSFRFLRFGCPSIVVHPALGHGRPSTAGARQHDYEIAADVAAPDHVIELPAERPAIAEHIVGKALVRRQVTALILALKQREDLLKDFDGDLVVHDVAVQLAGRLSQGSHRSRGTRGG